MYISYYLPEAVLTNEELEKLYNSPDWTASKIYRKTGIKKRHTATEETAADLAAKACEKLFSEVDIDRSSIDFLLVCTQSPDYFLPSVSCLVQNRLGLPISAGALDVGAGCSGYVYCLAVAKSLLESGVANRLLLVTAETYTKYINAFDRSTRCIFGDGAAATLLEKNDAGKIGKFVLGTDGRGAANLIVPAGALARRRGEESAAEHTDAGGNVRSMENLYMNGPEIFSFTLNTVPALINETLKKNGLQTEQIDCFVFHQANKFMLETLRDKLDLPHEKFYIDFEDIGNTTSSTIPIAMRRGMEKGALREGMKVLLAGFGVGYSWGAAVIEL